MDIDAVLADLEASGTAQNRKIYARHGAVEPMFGVSYANLGRLQKAIKIDHELAKQLWDTGVHDAQILACKIADPAALRVRSVDGWLRGCHSYVVVEALAGLVSASPIARGRAWGWKDRKGEMASSAGWAVVGGIAEELEKSEALELIEQIETEIHVRPNRTRHEMNMALIALGLRDDVRAQALAAAGRIGQVHVDHGETDCKTQDAVAYITRTLEHRRKKAAKAAGRRAAKRR